MVNLEERIVQEWSLSRAYDGFKNAEVDRFAVLSACHGMDPGADKLVTQELEGDLGAFGYLRLWAVCEGVRETSFWADEIPFGFAQRLASKHRQQGFIYGGPEVEGVAGDGVLVAEFTGAGSFVRGFRDFRPADFALAYSRWRQRPFRFENAIGNWMAAMGDESLRKQIRAFIESTDGQPTGEQIRAFVDGLMPLHQGI